jgi:hypothetical protein
MAKSIVIRPDAELLQKYFSKYGYWGQFYFAHFSKISVPAMTEQIKSEGFNTTITDYSKFKTSIKKFQLDSELIPSLYIIVLIAKANKEFSQSYSWAKNLKRQKNHAEELQMIEKLLAQFKNAYTILPEHLGIKDVKNFDTKRVINITLIRKGKETKYKFEDADIVSHIFTQLQAFIDNNQKLFELIISDSNIDVLDNLTKRNKVNSINKNNELLAMQRRFAKATFDFLSHFNIELSQNHKYILIGRLFELGGLLQSEKIFDEAIAPTTNYKSIGTRSKSSPYEKFLQQNIKKFIQESVSL